MQRRSSSISSPTTNGLACRPCSSAIAAAMLAACCSGCVTTGAGSQAQGSDPRLEDIERRIASSEQRLEQVRVEITASEARADQARQQAEIEQCKAQNSQIKAQAMAFQAQCLEEVASYNACEARRAESRADGTILGCLFGIGVAYATAGAALPLALGGCALGKVAGTRPECPVPSCTADFQGVEARVLRQAKLAELPMCGGYAGIAVKDEHVTEIGGVEVRAVGSGTTAASLGLASNDVLLGLQGRMVASDADVAKVLGQLRSGSKVRATIIRSHKRLTVEGTVRDVDVDGNRSRTRALLGATLGNRPVKVRYADAVRVLRVDGPAASAGLLPDMIIKGVNGRLVHSRDELKQALAVTPAGTEVVFEVSSGGSMERLSIRLEERDGRSGI